LRDAKSLEDLGRHFGGGLYEREALFLAAKEFAASADDVLERRTKHHLRLTPEQRSSFEVWFDAKNRTRTV
jgi:glycerol-3-phosphate dehydrogenase